MASVRIVLPDEACPAMAKLRMSAGASGTICYNHVTELGPVQARARLEVRPDAKQKKQTNGWSRFFLFCMLLYVRGRVWGRARESLNMKKFFQTPIRTFVAGLVAVLPVVLTVAV